jgi:hypothetical protein
MFQGVKNNPLPSNRMTRQFDIRDCDQPFPGTGGRRFVGGHIATDRSKQRVTGIRVVPLPIESFRREALCHAGRQFS